MCRPAFQYICVYKFRYVCILFICILIPSPSFPFNFICWNRFKKFESTTDWIDLIGLDFELPCDENGITRTLHH